MENDFVDFYRLWHYLSLNKLTRTDSLQLTSLNTLSILKSSDCVLYKNENFNALLPAVIRTAT